MSVKKKKQSISFYITSGNQDLLNKVNEIMASKGVLGYRDQSGRYHYIIDGSKGAPFAAMRLQELAQMRLTEDTSDAEQVAINAEFYVDAVLSCYNFDCSLQGFFLLRYMLIQLTLDPRLRHPLSKTLYPMCAENYQCSIAQVERNVRYCLQRLKERELYENQNHNAQLVFQEDCTIKTLKPFRALDENQPVYSNGSAIKLLEHEIRDLIRIDKKKAAANDSLH
ncbi:MAG: sporulation initiation factor Spo0A C-terminal domain-containing protein [Eubacteriales bacterium]|nr:sporulation initiation factor Spo0A C-terminal domain-containing protein [Eubacteriales bacterium]